MKSEEHDVYIKMCRSAAVWFLLKCYSEVRCDFLNYEILNYMLHFLLPVLQFCMPLRCK